ncbi:MAG: hypothetical protein PUK18_05535 [Firmicutes bacterium]|nr:hypothetical protein [Bacillota bacterium]MDY6161026.1 hypothetical protein [Candidatus Faecousia sp.]
MKVVQTRDQAAGDSHKPYGVDGLFPVQQTAVIIEPFGTDESVPNANTGKCTIQRTAQKSLPIGMHKCIPYENSVNAPYAAGSPSPEQHKCDSFVRFAAGVVRTIAGEKRKKPL